MMVCVDSSETKRGGGERFHPHRGTAKDFQVDIFLSHRPGRATKQSSHSSDDSDKEDHHFGTRFFKPSFGEVEDAFPGEKPAKRVKMYSSSSASSYTDQQDTMMMTAVGSHNHFQWIDKQKEQSLMNEVGTTYSDQHHASSPGHHLVNFDSNSSNSSNDLLFSQQPHHHHPGGTAAPGGGLALGMLIPITSSEQQQALRILENQRALLLEQNQQILADLWRLENTIRPGGCSGSHHLPSVADPAPPAPAIMILEGNAARFHAGGLRMMPGAPPAYFNSPSSSMRASTGSSSMLLSMLTQDQPLQQQTSMEQLMQNIPQNDWRMMGSVSISQQPHQEFLARKHMPGENLGYQGDIPCKEEDIIVAPFQTDENTYQCETGVLTSIPGWHDIPNVKLSEKPVFPPSPRGVVDIVVTSIPVWSAQLGTHQELCALEEETKVGGAINPLLYVPSDDRFLSEYQCLVRKQIEVFEVGPDELGSNAQGRNKPIVAGQVGVRCRHCSTIPTRHRTRGASYYPAQLKGIYQAAQNMASTHLLERCQLIPDGLRQKLAGLLNRKSLAGGGKPYWADSAASLGIVEVDGTIRFN